MNKYRDWIFEDSFAEMGVENEAFWASGKVIEEDSAAACSCAYDWTHGPAVKDEDARPNVELDGKALTAKVGRLRR